MCAIHLLIKWSLADLFQTQIQKKKKLRMKSLLKTLQLSFFLWLTTPIDKLVEDMKKITQLCDPL